MRVAVVIHVLEVVEVVTHVQAEGRVVEVILVLVGVWILARELRALVHHKPRMAAAVTEWSIMLLLELSRLVSRVVWVDFRLPQALHATAWALLEQEVVVLVQEEVVEEVVEAQEVAEEEAVAAKVSQASASLLSAVNANVSVISLNGSVPPSLRHMARMVVVKGEVFVQQRKESVSVNVKLLQLHVPMVPMRHKRTVVPVRRVFQVLVALVVPVVVAQAEVDVAKVVEELVAVVQEAVEDVQAELAFPVSILHSQATLLQCLWAKVQAWAVAWVNAGLASRCVAPVVVVGCGEVCESV